MYGFWRNEGGGRIKLSFEDLSFGYTDKLLLDQVSGVFETGRVVSIYGANGCGKTTFLKLVSGLLPQTKTRGQVSIDGSSFFELSAKQRADQVTFVSSEIQTPFPLKSIEVVRMAAELNPQTHLDRARIDSVVQDAMESTQTWQFKESDLGILSGGQRQRVALARAIARGAPFILLDESLSKMDLSFQYSMGRLLRTLAKTGRGIVWISHDVNLAAQWSDDAWFLSGGKFASQGSVKETFTQESFEKVYPEHQFELDGQGKKPRLINVLNRD